MGIGLCCCAEWENVKFSEYLGTPSYEVFPALGNPNLDGNLHPVNSGNSKFHSTFATETTADRFNFGYSVTGDGDAVYVAAGDRGVFEYEIKDSDGNIDYVRRIASGITERTSDQYIQIDSDWGWPVGNPYSDIWLGNQNGSRYGYEDTPFGGVYDICVAGSILYVAHGVEGIYSIDMSQSSPSMTQIYSSANSIYKHIVKMDEFLFVGTQGWQEPLTTSGWIDYSSTYAYPSSINEEGVLVFRIDPSDPTNLTLGGNLPEIIGVNSLNTNGKSRLDVAYGFKYRDSSAVEQYSGGAYEYKLTFYTDGLRVRQYSYTKTTLTSGEAVLCHTKGYYTTGASRAWNSSSGTYNKVTNRIYRGSYSMNTESLGYKWFCEDYASGTQHLSIQGSRRVGQSSQDIFYYGSGMKNLEYGQDLIDFKDDVGGTFPTAISVVNNFLVVGLWQRGITIIDARTASTSGQFTEISDQKFYGILDNDDIQGWNCSNWRHTNLNTGSPGNRNYSYSLSIIDVHYNKGAVYAIDSMQYTANGGGPGYWSPSDDKLYSPPVNDGVQMHGGLVVLTRN